MSLATAVPGERRVGRLLAALPDLDRRGGSLDAARHGKGVGRRDWAGGPG